MCLCHLLPPGSGGVRADLPHGEGAGGDPRESVLCRPPGRRGGHLPSLRGASGASALSQVPPSPLREPKNTVVLSGAVGFWEWPQKPPPPKETTYSAYPRGMGAPLPGGMPLVKSFASQGLSARAGLAKKSDDAPPSAVATTGGMFSWVDQAKQIFTGTAPASASPVSRLVATAQLVRTGCRKCCSCLQGSPVLCLIITPLVVLIFILIAVFNVCLARLLTAPGAVLFNVLLLWLATLEGTLLGLMVVEGLARNFRVQQRDQVKFTTEQVQLRGLVQAVEVWLSQAKVLDRRAEIPLNDWLQRHVQNVVKVPLRYAVNSTPLVSEAKAEAEGTLQRLEQLLHIFYDLQRSPDGLCASTRRFLRTPVVGSLNQLRAELLLRYSAQHYWVRTGGRKIDAVFISAKGDRGEALTEDADRSPDAKEDAPLKDLEPRGHVVVWCNPNAAYYETMAYESHWLDFYLSQGCSIFVFNYSGFGRSQGHPSPGRLSADGDAVVDFLRRRGFTQVAVHGRSIGGIAACRIARKNPDIVKVLVADRTFSTLAKAAKYTFGDWAAKAESSCCETWIGLFLFLQKVLLDATIPDLAALRTAVAQKVLEQVPSSERFSYEGLDRMAEAWTFFEVLLSICDACDGGCVCQPRFGESKRSARQPVVGKPVVETETAEAGDEDSRLVARPPTPAKVTVQ
eukprot:g31669.t1